MTGWIDLGTVCRTHAWIKRKEPSRGGRAINNHEEDEELDELLSADKYSLRTTTTSDRHTVCEQLLYLNFELLRRIGLLCWFVTKN